MGYLTLQLPNAAFPVHETSSPAVLRMTPLSQPLSKIKTCEVMNISMRILSQCHDEVKDFCHLILLLNRDERIEKVTQACSSPSTRLQWLVQVLSTWSSDRTFNIFEEFVATEQSRGWKALFLIHKLQHTIHNLQEIITRSLKMHAKYRATPSYSLYTKTFKNIGQLILSSIKNNKNCLVCCSKNY